MPKFEKHHKNSNDGEPKAPAIKAPMIVEPRCNVCKSQFRPAIDKMLAAGIGYTEISRSFNYEIDRRSIASHADKHMNYQDAAVRQIIEHEAEQMSENLEDGVRGVLARKAFLETALHKVHQAVLNDDVEVEVRDAIGIIQQLDKMDSATSSAAVDEIRVQFNAFLQALKETVAQEEWERILFRTREILEATEGRSNLPQLASPKEQSPSSED
jgi:hypothetical protein